jgi:hypothetical protein
MHGQTVRPGPWKKGATMTDCGDSGPVTNNRSTRLRSLRRAFRFGLLELLLVTAAVAVWIPAILALQAIPALKSEIQVMRQATLDLVVDDPTQLTARALPTVWANMNAWKYNAPDGVALQLRLATEGINSLALPADYQAVSLPAGKHTIQLKMTRDDQGLHNLVLIDGQLVLDKHHPPEWLTGSSSTRSSDVTNSANAFALNRVVRLRSEQADINHPLERYGNADVPREYDHKGLVLWISPAELEPEPAPRFIATQRRAGEWTIGHRTGIRVRSSTENDAVGLLDIQPSINAVLGEPRWGSLTRFGDSVRPIVNLDAAAEIPETQNNRDANARAIPLALHVEPSLGNENVAKMSSRLWAKRAMSDDGMRMTVFAHYQPFPSGAKPIVQILFDAEHPERIGFLPRAAAGSTPMQACELVTRFDSRFFWRKVALETANPDDEAFALQPVPFDQLGNAAKESQTSDVAVASVTASDWLEIPFQRLPLSRSESSGVRKLILQTDVADASKLSLPAGLTPRWQYQGIPNRQVWWLPENTVNETSSDNIKVELRTTNVFPGTDLRLPGGPAIGNVRITIPLPATEPIWLALEPDRNVLTSATKTE